MSAYSNGKEQGSAEQARAIAARLAEVRTRIARAAERAGRPVDSVTLVAVSKTRTVAEIEAAIGAGQLVFGENRVQEAAAKFAALREAHPGLRFHIIGGLQTNKAREAVRIADVIESLDRPKLVDAIEAAAVKEGRRPALLIEVNVGDEPQKSGVSRAEADAFIASCRARFGAALQGLMSVPPLGIDPAPRFAWLAAKAREHDLSVVSMGMSADFETAIAHGATWVRVGTAIFGERPKSPV